MTATTTAPRIVRNPADHAERYMIIGKRSLPLEIVALAMSEPWASAKQLPIVKCLECREEHTAEELYKLSDLPGCCDKCADLFFACASCDGYHHPDDPCA